SDLRVLRDLDHARCERDVRTRQLPGPALPIPALIRRTERVEHRWREPELFSERAGQARVLGDHRLDLSVASESKGEPDAHAMQRGGPGAEQPQHPGDLVELVPGVRIFRGLEGDVITEPAH